MSNVFNILSDETFKDRMDTTNLILASMARHWGEVVEFPLSSIKVESWADIQRIVRLGLANKMFNIGDQLVSLYGSKEITWDIIGFDHDVATDSQYKHSMTIQTHRVIEEAMFDAAEPTNPNSPRAQYGSNNYKESAIRQWLNSADSKFAWQPQTEYDVAPTGALYGGAGFLNLLDPELVAVIGTVKKEVARNTVTDGGGRDILNDKIFLPSRVEVYGGEEGVTAGEKPYPYYSSMAENPTADVIAGRIKYNTSGSARTWWLRSASVGLSYTPRIVHSTGTVSTNGANYVYGVSPACVII